MIRFFYSNTGIKNKIQLDPLLILGFVDGEGCFHVSILQNSKLKTGYMVSQWFEIHIHLKNEEVLMQIKEQLGVGNIYKSGQSVRLKVQSIKELKILLDFFQNNKLITQKRADYLLFCDLFNLVEQKKNTLLKRV